MAIDTAAKRRSAVMTRRLPWFRRFQPIPDGTVTQSDRQQWGLTYIGIPSGAGPVTGAAVIAWTIDFDFDKTETIDF